MALISLNNNIVEIKRVVAYGCSYTAGAELADEDFIKDADAIKRKIGLPKFNIQYSKIINSPELIEAQQKKTFVSHLSKLLEVDVLNRAMSGTGLEEHITRFRYDIMSNNLNRNDLVVLGITSMNRWVHIHPEWHSVIHFMSNLIDDSKMSRAMLTVYDDYKLLHLHLTYLEQFVQLAKENNLNLIGFPIHPEPIDEYLRVSPLANLDYLNVLKWRWKLLKRSPHYMWTNIMRDATKNQNDELHGGMHWKESVHIKFANTIFNNIKKC